MTATPTPTEVFTRLSRGIAERRWHELAELYAEDATVEIAFAVPAPRVLTGREALRAHFAAVAGSPLSFDVDQVVVHETTDPEVIIVEYDYVGHVESTGTSFRVANIQVLRVRDGRIVASRDFHNHLAVADALGRLPQLVAALSGTGK